MAPQTQMMRKHIPYRVCNCTPTGTITHLEARLLRQMVNREIHPLGDLCAETGHFLWALKVWYLGLSEICRKDYDEWRLVHFNTDVVKLDDVVSEEDAMILGRRMDRLWCLLGYPEEAYYERKAEAEYDFLWLEKYDCDRWEDID